MKLLIIICCLFSFSYSDFNRTDDIVGVKSIDTKMNMAIKNAQKTLPIFLKAFRKHDKAQYEFGVKVKITDKYGSEHFWTTDLKELKNGFSAKINNSPQVVQSVKYRELVNFTKLDITDWMFYDQDILQGGYTIKVMFEHMQKEDVERLKKDFGWK